MPENQEHREEIGAISALLSDSPREMPHRLPEGYFESLPGDILKLVNSGIAESSVGEETAREEIERLSPVLAKAMGVNPFSGSPTDVDASERMDGKVPVWESSPSTPVRSIRRPVWPAYAAAAAVAGIMALAVFKGSGDGEKGKLIEKGTLAGAETRPADSSLSGEQGLAEYMNASVDPILMTAEASDTLLLAEAFLILQSSDTAQSGLFDDIPTKDLYAYIEDMPDLSGTRLDME
jgi:hypothetical protein